MAEQKKIRKNKSQSHFLSKGGSVDKPFLLMLFGILCIGLLMLFSASYANAYYYYGDSFHFIIRQFIFAVIGIIGMFIVSKFDYRILKKFSNLIVIASLGLLVLVFTQRDLNDAHRWIFIGDDLLTFQPSEIAKFALIVFMAKYMTDNEDKITGNKMSKFASGINNKLLRVIVNEITHILPMLILVGVYCGLLILEPHLSATMIVICIFAAMALVGGMKLSVFCSFAVLGTVSLPLGIFVLGKWDRLMLRVDNWINPYAAASAEGYQVIQSLYAIGSGGLMGNGIGGSKQKYLYVPEPQNDFIFSIICEEIGFIGATLLIILFAVFICRGFSIGTRCKDKFGSMLCIGIIFQVGIQIIFNIAVVTNTIPNTGISLPFFSYGGTSLVMLLAQMGVVLSVSRENSKEDSDE